MGARRKRESGAEGVCCEGVFGHAHSRAVRISCDARVSQGPPRTLPNPRHSSTSLSQAATVPGVGMSRGLKTSSSSCSISRRSSSCCSLRCTRSSSFRCRFPSLGSCNRSATEGAGPTRAERRRFNAAGSWAAGMSDTLSACCTRFTNGRAPAGMP